MNISYSTWTLSSVSLSSPRLPESLSASLSPSLSLFSLLRHHHHRWKNIWTLHLSYLGASFTCSRMQKCHFTFKWSAFVSFISFLHSIITWEKYIYTSVNIVFLAFITLWESSEYYAACKHPCTVSRCIGVWNVKEEPSVPWWSNTFLFWTAAVIQHSLICSGKQKQTVFPYLFVWRPADILSLRWPNLEKCNLKKM